jgi:hypothetical protein
VNVLPVLEGDAFQASSHAKWCRRRSSGRAQKVEILIQAFPATADMPIAKWAIVLGSSSVSSPSSTGECWPAPSRV